LTIPFGLDSRSGAVSSTAPPVRVAVICDFLEEHWPSMDQTGDMLYQFLAQEHAREIAATQLRPAFHPRLTHLPFFRGPARNADRLLNRFLDYPGWLRSRSDQFELFHLVDHSYSQLVHSLPPGRTIVTCHDLDTFRCILDPEQDRRPFWFQAMTRRILDGFRQAAHVICNSNATRNELLRHGLFQPEKITVNYIGVHPAFTSFPAVDADREAARLLEASSQSTLLLSVGSTIPRKRMDVLLRVFASILEDIPEARLVRAGGAFTGPQLQLARELGVEKSILVLPFVSLEVLAALYRQAAVLLQTSDAEGFGMPLTEAMACGCPVVASDLEVLREVGGTACEYCPVGDIGAWKQTTVRLLREDARASELRRQGALTQVARYSWAEHARRTVEIYRGVLKTF
jgi:glycosyltransferase involved in cell wall biosynthesis